MIENLRKHIGVLGNTGVRVAVVFRKVPNDEVNCLIVETERLPDSYHDYIQQVLSSKEAKETNDFFEILNRRTFPDGTNCLTTLHTRGYLRKEPVANVKMIPLPGQEVPLALINASIDKKVDEYNAKQSATVIDPVVDGAMSGATVDPSALAKGLILQAELMEKDAASKREEAYSLDPSLKPGPGRPPLKGGAKVISDEDRKAKRRERDRANAEKAKVAKKESALEAKVAAKLKRDAARLAPT